MKIKYSAITGKGKVRKKNQDRIYVRNNNSNVLSSEEQPIFAVFDGMGGEQYGEVASEIAYNTVKDNAGMVSNTKICILINEYICSYMQKNNIFRMGTTAAIVEFLNDNVYTCNVGDTRIYRVANNEIEQLSVDHVVNTGRYKTRRVLTQYLGIPENEVMIEPYERKTTINIGDIFLLCSDGLTDMVTDEVILEIIRKNNIETLAQKLYDVALANGGKDNISVIVCKVIE